MSSATSFEKVDHRIGKDCASVGLFGDRWRPKNVAAPNAAMPKSAEAQTFRHLLHAAPSSPGSSSSGTLEAILDERREDLRRTHRLTAADLDCDEPPSAAEFWRQCLASPPRAQGLRSGLRQRGVSDPGLRAAGGTLRRRSLDTDAIAEDGPEAEPLLETIPDLILTDNLYGVDLSHEAVEITQLALWIRSARRGKTSGRPVAQYRQRQQPGAPIRRSIPGP